MPGWFYAASAVIAALGAVACLVITIDVLISDAVDPHWFPLPAGLAAGFVYATFYLGAQI